MVCVTGHFDAKKMLSLSSTLALGSACNKMYCIEIDVEDKNIKAKINSKKI